MTLEQAIEKAKTFYWSNYVFFDNLHSTYYACERKPIKDEHNFYTLNDLGKNELLGHIDSCIVELFT